MRVEGDYRTTNRAVAMATPGELLFVRLLSLTGLVGFALAPLWALQKHQLIFKDSHMWLKALGLICAGVFVGAAVIEAKQLVRKKRKTDVDQQQEQADEEAQLVGDNEAR